MAGDFQNPDWPKWFAEYARAFAEHYPWVRYYTPVNEIGTSIGAGDVYGYYVITRQYFDRYRMPAMHTETNRAGKHAEEWLWKEFMNLLRLREDGMPIVGFTWFGLVDMKDWDTALTQMNGTVNPVGLYTLQRKQRKVARAYRKMVEEYSQLPISSTKFPVLTA